MELELAARPLARLDLNATLGFLDAEYEEFATLVGGVVTDVSDRELVNAPEWSASLDATYEWPLTAALIGTAHVGGAYRAKTYTEITASEVLAQDAYTLVSAFLSVKAGDGRWELRGGVQNLTDEEIRVQGFNLSEFPGYQLSSSPPRAPGPYTSFYHY